MSKVYANLTKQQVSIQRRTLASDWILAGDDFKDLQRFQRVFQLYIGVKINALSVRCVIQSEVAQKVREQKLPGSRVPPL